MAEADNGVNHLKQARAEATARIRAMDHEPLEQAIAIMAFLRSAEGCPWDREQSFDTIKRHTLEETYEVFDAIERRDWTALQDELGDLLLQVLFYAQMAADAGLFTIWDVALTLSAKLIRRHPHIFQGAEAADASAVVERWEEIKQAERKLVGEGEPASLLAAVPRTMPAMLEAAKLGSKAAKVGFDWPDVSGVFEKLREEAGELEAELPAKDAEAGSRVVEEFGDLLFTVVNLGRHLGVDVESALRGANAKFRQRFGAMEKAAGRAELIKQRTPEDLDRMWGEAKQATHIGVSAPAKES